MDYDQLLNLGTELGLQLMRSGAEIYRVEESVSRLLSAYGMQAQVFAIPHCLIVSVNTPQGHPITKMCRTANNNLDVELLERCNALCRHLCQEVPPIEQAREYIRILSGRHRQFSPKIKLLAYLATSASFALSFGGTLGDSLAAAIAGLVMGFMLLFGKQFIGSNAFLRTALCSATASMIALWCVQLGVAQNLESVTISVLMLLVPGRAVTAAMREIMAGDMLSGMSRTAEVIVIGTAIALGSALPMMITQLR